MPRPPLLEANTGTEPRVVTHPKLFKTTSAGKIQEWSIRVEPNDDDTATIVVVYGLVGGKLQTKTEVISAGLNLGKKNATTAWEQAKLEAAATWAKQKDRKHYGLDPSGAESAAKRAAAPMLAAKYKDEVDNVSFANAWMQPKLDGHRCLAFCDRGVVRLVSRRGTPLDVPHIAAAVGSIVGGECVLDGELYCHGAAVTKIGGWIKKKQPETLQLEYRVYDVVMASPYADRKAELDVVFGGESSVGPIHRVPTFAVRSREELDAFFVKCLEDGYEGAMLRWGDSPYESDDRSRSLLKVKPEDDAEFEVIGFTEAKGSHAGMAIFRCVTDQGHEFGVLAPGTHAEKRHYFEHGHEYVGRHLTVEYAYFTQTEKPVPFHGRAKQFREDI